MVLLDQLKIGVYKYTRVTNERNKGGVKGSNSLQLSNDKKRPMPQPWIENTDFETLLKTFLAYSFGVFDLSIMLILFVNYQRCEPVYPFWRRRVTLVAKTSAGIFVFVFLFRASSGLRSWKVKTTTFTP